MTSDTVCTAIAVRERLVVRNVGRTHQLRQDRFGVHIALVVLPKRGEDASMKAPGVAALFRVNNFLMTREIGLQLHTSCRGAFFDHIATILFTKFDGLDDIKAWCYNYLAYDSDTNSAKTHRTEKNRLLPPGFTDHFVDACDYDEAVIRYAIQLASRLSVALHLVRIDVREAKACVPVYSVDQRFAN